MYDPILFARGANGELTSQEFLPFSDRIVCIYVIIHTHTHTHTYMYVEIKESDDQHV